jgi:hypothetical protein
VTEFFEKRKEGHYENDIIKIYSFLGENRGIDILI